MKIHGMSKKELASMVNETEGEFLILVEEGCVEDGGEQLQDKEGGSSISGRDTASIGKTDRFTN